MSLFVGGEDYIAMPDALEVQTDVSLVTGKLRTIGVTDHMDTVSTAMVTRNQNMAVSEVPADTAGLITCSLLELCEKDSLCLSVSRRICLHKINVPFGPSAEKNVLPTTYMVVRNGKKCIKTEKMAFCICGTS